MEQQAESQAEWLISKARANGADAVEVVWSESLESEVKWRLGKLEGVERAESAAVGLRVLVGKRQASSSTNLLDKENLEKLAAQVVTMAKLAPEDPYARLAKPGEFTKDNDPTSLEINDPEELSPERMRDMAAEAEDAARAIKGISNSEGGGCSQSRSHTLRLTSEGYRSRVASSSTGISVSVLAEDENGMQRDYDYALRRWASDLPSPSDIGKSAAERTLKRLGGKKMPTCSVPVVFDPRVARSLLSSFASAINGQAVARKSSFLRDRMGDAIFADTITIIDDPRMLRGLSSRMADAEGLPTQKREMVKNGVLQSWFLDLATAAQLDLTSTAHAGRGLSSPPSPGSSNLYIANGTRSPKELLAAISTGFYVTETFGMGINTVTGDYSQGAAGFWIENGELTHAVHEMTIAGHMSDIFAKLEAANDLKFDYATNSPTLLLPPMMVAGA
ncbi:TldD/PmbA family protein [bacterium]|nr:TldD/PmbA family protein [bacterium]